MILQPEIELQMSIHFIVGELQPLATLSGQVYLLCLCAG
jgi:hypothetical protein